MKELLESNKLDEARDEVNAAKEDMNIFIASHFTLSIVIDMEIDSLIQMTGTAIHDDKSTAILIGRMVGDTDWSFELMATPTRPAAQIHIPVEVLEDYLDSIETAEDYLQNYGSEE